MLHVGLVCAAMAFADPGALIGNELHNRYETEFAKAGRDAESQIQLALWCESHGLTTERTKHLAFAVLTDPSNATARGLLGMVNHAGKWRRPDAVAEKWSKSPILALSRRSWPSLSMPRKLIKAKQS